VPAALIAVVALFTPHAGAQTMGEYANATAGVATGGGSTGANLGPASTGSGDLGGGSGTWGANGLGGSWSDRVGAVSPFAAGADFESRTGSMTSGAAAQSRWPGSKLAGADTSGRFGDSSARFPDKDRLLDDSGQSPTTNRFPPSLFNDNPNGLDTTYNPINNH